MSATPELKTISNTSPLLYLHQIAQLDLLPALYSRLLVPRAVERELSAGQALGIDVPHIQTLGWIEIAEPANPALIPHTTDLGQGEAEAIALGVQHPGSLLILDDRLGRQIANLYSLRYTGTLGVLIKAKQRGLLSTIKPALQQLRERGFWLSEAIIAQALALAGEPE